MSTSESPDDKRDQQRDHRDSPPHSATSSSSGANANENSPAANNTNNNGSSNNNNNNNNGGGGDGVRGVVSANSGNDRNETSGGVSSIQDLNNSPSSLSPFTVVGPNPQPQPKPAEKTVYVGNLASKATEDIVVAFFSTCGRVTAVRLAGDPSYAVRFAFIEFADKFSAQRACELSGTELLGRQLRVMPSKTPITPPNPVLGLPVPEQYLRKQQLSVEQVARTVYVAGVDIQLTEEQVQQFFSVCGPVTAVRLCGDTGHPSRFAFVEFATIEAAMTAQSLSGLSVGNHAIKVSPSKTAIQSGTLTPTVSLPPEDKVRARRTLYVGSVDVNATENDLRMLFSACGTVSKVVLAGDTVHAARFAFVEMSTDEEALKAVSLNGTLLGDRPIRVNQSKTPITNSSAAAAYRQSAARDRVAGTTTALQQAMAYQQYYLSQGSSSLPLVYVPQSVDWNSTQPALASYTLPQSQSALSGEAEYLLGLDDPLGKRRKKS
ncbi:Polyadenylate-binding protein [Pelomyxa schiedti]|nr:Polyadenylate-binding protein [Pelomyxa schiedti]